MNDLRPSVALRTENTERIRATGWFVEANPVKKRPTYRRTDVLVLSAAAGLLVLAGLFAFMIAATTKPHRPATAAAAATIHESISPTTANHEASGPVLPAATAQLPAPPMSSAQLPAAPRTSTHPSATVSNTTTAPAKPPEPLGASGRFSGVISAKNGDTWMITGWDGTAVPVHVTPNTQLNAPIGSGPQFGPGQTVSIFWVNSGGTRVAQTVYGVS